MFSDKFLTPPAVGKILGCGSDKVLELIRNKELKAAKVGDTVTVIKASSGANLPSATEPLPGFKEVQPQVFAGLYPSEASEYDALREAPNR